MIYQSVFTKMSKAHSKYNILAKKKKRKKSLNRAVVMASCTARGLACSDSDSRRARALKMSNINHSESHFEWHLPNYINSCK